MNRKLNTKYLIQELRKLDELMTRRTDAVLSGIGNPARAKYVREKVLPILDREIEMQQEILAKEATELIESKNER